MGDSSLGLTRKVLVKDPVIFSKVQTKIRNAISGDAFLDGFKARDVAEDGTLPLKSFFSCLSSMGLIFEEIEAEYISNLYSNHRAEVDYVRFYKALDLAVPDGHADPDLFFDTLPQPYRLISKILEFDILDAAWFEIIRLHPDVQADLSGDVTAKKHTKNLETRCLPSTLTEQHVTSTSVLGGHSFIYMANSSGILTVIDALSGRMMGSISIFRQQEESLVVINGVAHISTSQGRVERVLMSTIHLSPPSVTPPDVTHTTAHSTAPHGHNTASTPAHTPSKVYRFDISVVDVGTSPTSVTIPRIAYNFSFECHSDGSDVHASITDDGGVVSVSYGSELFLYYLHGAKHNHNQSQKGQGGQVMHDESNTNNKNNNSNNNKTNKNLIIHEDKEINEFNEHGTIVLKDPTVKLDLQPFMTTTRYEPVEDTTNSTDTISGLPPSFANKTTAGNSNSNNSNTTSMPSTATATPTPTVPVSKLPSQKNITAAAPPIQLQSQQAPVQLHTSKPLPKLPQLPPPKVQKLFLFPLDAPINSKKNKKMNASKSPFIEYLCGFAIAIVWQGSKEWCVLSLQEEPQLLHEEIESDNAKGTKSTLKNVPKPSVDVVAKDKQQQAQQPPPLNREPSATARKSISKTRGPDSITAAKLLPPSAKLLAKELTRWSLSSEVTAIAHDDHRTMLVLGQSDGSVTVWDLRSLILCGGDFGKHETAVTQLALCIGRNLRLVSGSVDGSMCFFNIESGPSNTSLTAALTGNASVPFGSYRVSLLDFRQDIRAPIVSLTSIVKSPFFVAVTGKGNTLLYDADSMEALGTLVSRSLQPGIPSVWRPVCQSRLKHLHHHIPDPQTNKTKVPPTSKTLVVQEPVNTVAWKDFPVNWPDGSFDSAFGTTPEAVRLLRALSPLSSACLNGYLGLVRDVSGEMEGLVAGGDNGHKTVALVCYSMAHVLNTLCPGVAAICNALKQQNQNQQQYSPLHSGSLQELSHHSNSHSHTHPHSHNNHVINPLALYNMLTPVQRVDPMLTPEQVEGLVHTAVPSQGPMNKTNRSLNRTTSVATAQSGANDSFSSTLQRTTLRNMASGLTEKKLRALESSFEKHGVPLEDPVAAQNYAQLKSWDKIKDPEAVSRRARTRSAQERIQRASRIMNRLNDLANLFD
eukprot:gene260-476_t